MKMALSTLLTIACATMGFAAQFERPVRLKAGGAPVSVEPPGYASPCLADVNSDGRKDLLVGQYSRGRIKMYKALADGEFAAGEWLKAGDRIAEIPGVW